MDEHQPVTATGIAAIGLLVIVIAGLAYLFGPAYLRRARRELTRSERIAEIAAELGLTFSAGDPAFPGATSLHFPFELFSRGDRQVCENVIAGELDGMGVRAFDLLYFSETAPEPVRWSCAIAEIGGDVPHLVIEPASPGPELPASHDGERVLLEWGDFNARFRVFTRERGFAAALLDVQVMAWLMDSGPRVAITWETQRRYLLARAPLCEPDAFAELIKATVEFARRVPKAAGRVA
jgi:hypothetical protein